MAGISDKKALVSRVYDAIKADAGPSGKFLIVENHIFLRLLNALEPETLRRFLISQGTEPPSATDSKFGTWVGARFEDSKLTSQGAFARVLNETGLVNVTQPELSNIIRNSSDYPIGPDKKAGVRDAILAALGQGLL